MSDPTPATEQRPSRSPFTRISSALGLTQKPRWIQDFRIQLDHKNPTHRYNPGDVIRGTIFFTPTKAVKITHTTISLYGYVHIYKSYNAPGDFVSKESLHTDPSRLLGVPGIVPLFTPVEEILFGDVKLQPCRGQFQFGLRLPSHRLPSSIDFERGSIQYNLIATVTRPNQLNPVIRSDPKKFLVYENIDCSKFPTPKQRVVTLEAVEKKKKRGKKAPSLAITAEKFGTISTSEREPPSPRSSLSPSTDGSHHDDAVSVSNSSSSTELRITNISSHPASNPTSLNGSSQSGSHDGSQDGSHVSGHNSRVNSSQNCHPSTSQKGSAKAGPKAASTSQLVYASAEIMGGAFLPGDSIPVRVQVNHIKPVKSMCGLIVTLYRKTHIETEPLVHQKVRDENGNITLQPITGDVYPKSLTGFGGLSMSNKQTSHTFRMDVAQTHVPLFTDRISHKADIKVKLEIPSEGVHPTIAHVRGDTLDFRYYVEICLDIQGKLEESRLLPRLTNQAIHGLGKPSARKSPSVPMSLAAQGQQMIDTQAIRREKPQVVSWTFEVVIGTKDSGRGIKSLSRVDLRRQADPWQAVDARMQQQSSMQGSESSRATRLDDVQEDTVGEERRDLNSRGTAAVSDGGNGTRKHSPIHRSNASPRANGQWPHYSRSFDELPPTPSYSPPPPPAPPLLLSDEPLDEKARLKKQEQRLLPSRPEDEDEEGPFSAPPAEDFEHSYLQGPHYQPDSGYGSSGGGTGPSGLRPPVRRSRTYDGETRQSFGSRAMERHDSEEYHYRNNDVERPVAVSSGAFSGFDFSQNSPSRPTAATDDKQELERRRLMDQRSAPDYGDPEHETQPHLARESAASPVDRDRHAAFADWDESQDGLPQYEQLDDRADACARRDAIDPR